MIDKDTLHYRIRELAEARPNPAASNPQIKVSGPMGQSKWLRITPAEYFRVVGALTTEPPITYAVQAHEINTLTWPMWEACGIECPAMIGADCPRKTIDARTRPAKVQHCPGWSGKFPHAAAEVVYGWTMESGQDETCGDVNQPIGWNAIFRTPEDERHDDNPMGAGVVLLTDSQGFVTLARYFDADLMEREWADLQQREAAYERANCENCAELNVPCDDHDED